MNNQSTGPSSITPAFVLLASDRAGSDPSLKRKVLTTLPSAPVRRGYYVSRSDPQFYVYVEGYSSRIDSVTVTLDTPDRSVHPVQAMTSGIFNALFEPTELKQ